MHLLLERLAAGWNSRGDIASDARSFLLDHGFAATADHCARVASLAGSLAVRFGADETGARVAGWLHDISAVIPVPERLSTARQLEIQVLPEEEAAPMLLHQKLSACMAATLFGVTDGTILAAIACHTTLKPCATQLDKVVFLADKIAWDQQGSPPYLGGCLAALEDTRHGALDRAVLHYLDYLWKGRAALPALHPWFAMAYRHMTR